MVKWHGYLGGGATGVAVVVAGYLVWSFLAARDVQEPPGAEPVSAETAAIPDSRPETAAPASGPDVEPQSEAQRAPRFDLVRIEPDGSALVAGEGGEGAAVVIYLDGEAIGEATAGGDGRFVSLLDIPPAAQPRLMTLATRQAGAETFSDAEIIISPFGADPAEVARAQEAMTAASPARGSAPAGAVVEAAAGQAIEAVAETTLRPGTAGAAQDAALAVGDAAGGQRVQPRDPAASDVTAPTGAAAALVDGAAPASQATALAGTAAEAPAQSATARPAVSGAAAVGAAAQADASGAARAPVVLTSDAEGVRVLSGPVAPEQVAIDTISYGAAGQVRLSGRGAAAGGQVRVYLDNRPVTSGRLRADGSWQVVLPEVGGGVYTLRVDELDASGQVTSRAETPFLREDREVLQQAAAGGEGRTPLQIVTVQPGNTLWQIARERYGEGLLYVRVFDANRSQIRNPDLIYPGQVFDLPDRSPAEQVETD